MNNMGSGIKIVTDICLEKHTSFFYGGEGKTN